MWSGSRPCRRRGRCGREVGHRVGEVQVGVDVAFLGPHKERFAADLFEDDRLAADLVAGLVEPEPLGNGDATVGHDRLHQVPLGGSVGVEDRLAGRRIGAKNELFRFGSVGRREAGHVPAVAAGDLGVLRDGDRRSVRPTSTQEGLEPTRHLRWFQHCSPERRRRSRP